MRCISQKGAYNAIKWPQTVRFPNTAPKNLRKVVVTSSPFGNGMVGNNNTLKKLPHNSLHSSRLRVPATMKNQIVKNRSQIKVTRMMAAVCVNENNSLITLSMIPPSQLSRLLGERVVGLSGLVEVAVIIALSSFFPQPTEDISQFTLFSVCALQ